MNRTTSSPRGGLGQWLASSINELALTFWTSTSFYLMYVTGGHNEFVLFFPLAAGVPLFLWLTWNKPVIARVDPVMTAGVFLLVFSILGSYLFNIDNYEPIFMLGNIGASLVLFFTLYLIVMKIEIDLWKLLLFQSIYIDLLLPVVIHNSTMVWGRLEPFELQANFPPMMGVCAMFGALSMRNLFAAGALAALPLYTMLMMQSRASIIATSAAITIVVVNYLWQHRSKEMMKRFGVAFVFGGIIVVGAALAGYSIFDVIGNLVNKVLLLDDDQRGMGTGGSGRSDLWAAAYNLWAAHPLFGVGFKGHPNFMPDHMVAHNAFLGLLADNGLVGLFGYLLIIAVAGFYIIKRGGKGQTMFGQRAAIIFPYFLYGMVESRAFSFGNTYSVLFLLVAFDSAKHRVAKSLTPKPATTVNRTQEPQRAPTVGTLSR